MTNRDLAVIVVAAGRGERLKSDKPKAFVEINGRTILAHSLLPIAELQNLNQVVIAAPDSHLTEAIEIANQVFDEEVKVTIVVGGETRQQSISNALAQVEAEYVLVHDAARAFASSQLFDSVYNKVQNSKQAVIPAIAIADTVKRVSDDLVLETVDRSALRSAQTPQGFVTADLKRAYAEATNDFTDDAALFQSLGKKVLFVEGEANAAKITTPDDLGVVLARLNGPGRTGIGTDVHRFSSDPSKKLYLGTIEWPGVPGLDGHSDGDVAAHAICDALFAATGTGDLGSNFGTSRPEYAGASGTQLLQETLNIVTKAGYSISNVAVQIIGNRPRIGARRAEAIAAISSALGGAPVSILATTTDGMGLTGEGKGVAAIATALVFK